MTEFTSILTRWLWRFFPALWLGFIVDHLLHWALCVLEDEDHLTRLFIRRSRLKRLIERRALKLQRLVARSEHQLEIVHHPIASTTTIFQIRSATIFRCGATIPTIPTTTTTTTTTIFPFRSIPTIFFASGATQAIRAPPWLGLDVRNQTQPNPQASPLPRRSAAKAGARMRDRA